MYAKYSVHGIGRHALWILFEIFTADLIRFAPHHELMCVCTARRWRLPLMHHGSTKPTQSTGMMLMEKQRNITNKQKTATEKSKKIHIQFFIHWMQNSNIIKIPKQKIIILTRRLCVATYAQAHKRPFPSRIVERLYTLYIYLYEWNEWRKN